MHTRRSVAFSAAFSAASIVAVLSLHACGNRDASTASAPTTSDSAGVSIVSNSRAMWTDASRWTIDSVPAITIGEGGDSVEALAGILAQRRLVDGTIVLVPWPANQMRFYSADGKFIRVAGRSGQGPGEFRSIGGVFPCGGDSIIVADVSRRISVWKMSGEFVRESMQPVSVKGFNPTVVGASADCSSILVRDARPLPPEQQSGRHLNQLNWRPLNGTVAESVTAFPGIEAVQVMYNGFPMRQGIVFGNQPEFAVSPAQVVVGMGDAAEFRVFDVHGKLSRIVRWDQKPTSVTDADRAFYAEQRAEYIRKSPEDARALPPIELLMVAKTKPLYAQIMLDDAGNTWLCQCADRNVLFKKAPGATDVVAWMVFDSTGSQLGTVDIPAMLKVQRVSHDEIAGVWTNADDAPSVRIYRIKKPGR